MSLIIRALDHAGLHYTDCGRDYLLAAGVPLAVVDAAEAAQLLADAHAARRAAYAAESDPLYLEWQYDQTAEKEATWRAKVAEVKARYPLPGE
ncbi:TPA: hypothetical protein ACKPXH_003954 [Pseudomonas aeruginosa]